MSIRNRTLGGIGLLVAAVATLSSIGCDPYIQADNSAPVVIGTMMVDTSYNTWNYTGVAPPDSAGCTRPYPEVYKTWADQAFPGLCNPENALFGIPTVCPVNCYPPRVGPAYAPLYMGNLGGTYQTTAPGGSVPYTYQLPTTWSLGSGPLQAKVPPNYIDWQGDWMTYGQIRILFNKLMNPATIQPDPLTCAYAKTPTTLKVYKNGVEVGSDYSVCYMPNSDTTYWGASLTVTPPGDFATLDNNATYRVVGTVGDQQGNSVSIDVQVVTGADVLDVPAGLTYSTLAAVYTVNTAISPNVPSSTGGEIYSYTVTPALPAGLKISAATGIISGTPTAASPLTTYTVKGCNYANYDVTLTSCSSATVTIKVQ